MKIDLLFFNTKFENKEDYISDNEKFEEYILTHTFQGKHKELLFLPASFTKNKNNTLLIYKI